MEFYRLLKSHILFTLLIVISESINYDKNDSPCPVGWIWVPNLEKCFFFSTKIAKWRHARNICMQHSGTLIRILDTASWNFLQSELPRHYSPNEAFYIGLSDITSDGVFEWEHSLNDIHKDGLFNKYIYPYYGERWCNQEPNGRNSFECVVVRLQKQSLCYEDVNCSTLTFYGCEIRKQQIVSVADENYLKGIMEFEKINATLQQTNSEIERYRQILKSTVYKLVSMASRALHIQNQSQEWKYQKFLFDDEDNDNVPSELNWINSTSYCYTERNRYIKGQIFKKDECTNCLCKSHGIIVCEKLECELRDKNCTDGSKLRYFSGVCCPLCENEVRTKYPYLFRMNKTAKVKN